MDGTINPNPKTPESTLFIEYTKKGPYAGVREVLERAFKAK